MLLATKLFQTGRLTSARSAELCGLSRVAFLFEASKVGVSPIQLDDEELKIEFAER